jgi:hypothetical protein
MSKSACLFSTSCEKRISCLLYIVARLYISRGRGIFGLSRHHFILQTTCLKRSVNNKNKACHNSTRGTSNGKSSIVEERLYSFFFALLQKNEASFFSFFLFFIITNEDVRFASIFVKFENVSLRSHSFSQIFGIHQFFLPSTLRVLG